MVEITDIPITGKMKDQFIEFFKTHDLNEHIGDLMKIDGGLCVVCGHPLRWSFHKSFPKKEDIGICCGTNLIALQKCNGNFDKINFERIVSLEKKTISKRQAEWKQQQTEIEMEIKYNDEFKFCKSVQDVVLTEPEFQEYINNQEYIYAGLPKPVSIAFTKMGQINSWLAFAKKGIVNKIYLTKLRATMNQSPQEILTEIKNTLVVEFKKQEEKQNQEKKYREHYDKVVKISFCRLAKFDTDFVDSLGNYFLNNKYYSEKQIAAIDKLCAKYRKQLGEGK